MDNPVRSDAPCGAEHPFLEKLRCELYVAHGGSHWCDDLEWAVPTEYVFPAHAAS